MLLSLALIIVYNFELSLLNMHHIPNSPVVVTINYKASDKKKNDLKKMSSFRFIAIDQSTFPGNSLI